MDEFVDYSRPMASCLTLLSPQDLLELDDMWEIDSEIGDFPVDEPMNQAITSFFGESPASITFGLRTVAEKEAAAEEEAKVQELREKEQRRIDLEEFRRQKARMRSEKIQQEVERPPDYRTASGRKVSRTDRFGHSP